MNDDLKQIHDELVTQVGALSQAYDATNDPNAEKAIATEIGEFTHRINILQTLLFVEASDDLAAAVPGIKNASTQLTQALNVEASVTGFINAASTFLGYVDKAIDLAKTLAVV